MSLLSTLSKYAWIPYLFLCTGLVVLFGTEEWLLFHYKTPNELVVVESKFFDEQPLEIFRRALNELDEDEINLLYSAALTAAQTRAVTASSKPDFFDTDTTPKLAQLLQAQARPMANKLTFGANPNPNAAIDNKPHVPESQANVVEMNGDLALPRGVNTRAIVTDVHRATVDELKSNMQPINAPMVNKRFVFHNKIPKAGSTTMKWLLVGLSKRNGFELDHQRWCIGDVSSCSGRDPVSHRQIDGPDGEEAIAEYVPRKLEENQSGKYLLLKHHHWFNFTDFGIEMPTYINIARDPVTRFASWYYFERYGWNRQAGARDRFGKSHGEQQETSQDDLERTLDECVLEQHPECLEPVQVLVKYFCGTVKTCSMMDKTTNGHNWRQVAIATERAKSIIARYFHVVGVLENFEQTLALFEKMLPEYFAGAPEVYHTPAMQKQRESSKSKHRTTLNETRAALEHGVLRYEVDIYHLIKTLFYEKLQFYNIPLPEQ